MADLVNLELEGMIPELDQLQQLELFTKAEIKHILKKRTNFEYAVKRKQKQTQKLDWLKYIEYESDLHKLKLNRLNRKVSELKNTRNPLDKLQEAQVRQSAILRQHALYERAKSHNPKELSFWSDHHAFCRVAGSWKKLAASLSSAISQHPSVPSFWIEAASLEQKRNKNIQAARALYQRALRINPQSQELWLGYFGLEFKHWKSQTKPKSQEKPTQEHNVEVETLQQEKESTEDKISLPLEQFRSGIVLRSVYKYAIQKIPDNLNFRMSFLKEYQLNYAPELQTALDEVYDSIARDFGSDPKCIKILAEKEMLANNNSLQKGLAVFENSVQKDAPLAVWLEYIHFCEEMLKQRPNESILQEALSNIYPRAVKAKIHSAELFSHWIQNLVQRGKSKEAMQVANQATSLLPKSSEVWLLRIKLLLREDTSITREQCTKMFLDALQNNVDHPEQLWSHFLEYCVLSDTAFDTILSHYKRAIIVLGRDSWSIRTAFLLRTSLTYGIERTRQVYECTLDAPPVSESYYLLCVKLEKLCPSVDTERIRKIYNRAVIDQGKESEDIWIDFLKWETEQGNHSKAHQLFWNAKHTLANPSAFIARYSMMNNGLLPTE